MTATSEIATANTGRTTYVERAKAKLNKWDTEIDLLQTKVKSLTADAQVEYQPQIFRLSELHQNAHTQFRRIRDADNDAWLDRTEAFDETSKSLTAAMAKVMRELYTAVN